MVGLIWLLASRSIPDLPSPLRTWEESKLYLLEPFAKRGEMDQGIVLLASYSLMRVAKGFLLGIGLATPLGLLLGMSPTLQRMFDPVIQILRPISPLAWLPLGLVVFQRSEPAAMFAIAICSMWPTVIKRAGVAPFRRTTGTSPRSCGFAADDVHQDRRARDAAASSRAIVSASASPGWSSSRARC